MTRVSIEDGISVKGIKRMNGLLRMHYLYLKSMVGFNILKK